MKDKIKYRKGYPYPLGANKLSSGIQFCVEVPAGEKVNLCIYRKNYKKPLYVISLTEEYMYGRVASILIENLDIQNYEYSYEINGKNLADNYAVTIIGVGKFGTNIDFSNVKYGFLQEFDWEGTKNPNLSLGEIILYRMNVRGFTKSSSSNVENNGTFSGIKEKIPYLLDLGVNQIELMPVYEFLDTVPVKESFKTIDNMIKYKCNFWGYSDVNYYFSVKKVYAAGSDASIELKELIRELHRNNIEIILEFYFTRDVNIQFILDCLKFWVYEYHVDGFHLSGDIPDISIVAKEPFLSDKKIYAAYFPVNEIYGKKKNKYKNRNLIESTEQYKQAIRSFLKSDMGRGEETAYLMRKDKDLVGTVNYICNHDGFTMFDFVSYEQKHNEKNGEDNMDGTDYNFSWNCGFEGSTNKKKILNLRKRQMKNAWVMLLFSKGIPAILAGDELCNSQKGNNNAYCQDNNIGWVNWNTPKSYSDLFEFVKTLIGIRKEYNVIWTSSESEENFNRRKHFPLVSYHGEKAWDMVFRPSSRHFGIMYFKENDTLKNSKAMFIAYNMNWSPQQFALPRLPKAMNWYKIIDTSIDDISRKKIRINEQYMTLKERSCVILTSG